MRREFGGISDVSSLSLVKKALQVFAGSKYIRSEKSLPLIDLLLRELSKYRLDPDFSCDVDIPYFPVIIEYHFPHLTILLVYIPLAVNSNGNRGTKSLLRSIRKSSILSTSSFIRPSQILDFHPSN